MYEKDIRVKVVIEEPVDETCEAINGATGIIIDKDEWVFPYTIKLDDPKLNELITDIEPRRFSPLELKLI